MSTNFTALNRKLTTSLLRLIGLFVIAASFVGDGNAQTTSVSATKGYTPSGFTPGSPAGSYALSGFDTVNPYNGGLNFNLPLRGVQGRGEIGYTIPLQVEQKWTAVHDVTVNSETGQQWDSFTATSSRWSTSAGYTPGLLQGRQIGSGSRSCTDWGSPTYTYYYTVTRLTFVTPDGTEFELRDQLTGGQQATVPPCTAPGIPGFSRGSVFVTADGSAATFISDEPIHDDNTIGASGIINPSGYLMLRDGTRYRITYGDVKWMRDRNGNMLTFNAGVITDSIGRQITLEYEHEGSYGNCDKIIFKGFGGTERVIRVCRTNLGNALRSGFQLRSPLSLFPELGNGSSVPEDQQVVSTVWLPDGDGVTRKYNLRYNSYGELARVELPTGGAYEYDWAAGVENGPESGVILGLGYDPLIYRRVIVRREYPDGGTGNSYTSKITYSRPEAQGSGFSNLGYVVLSQYNNVNGVDVLRAATRHYYNGSPIQSMAASQLDPLSYSHWQEGREYKTELLDSDAATVLRRVETNWQQGIPVSPWAPDMTNNPRILSTTTTIEPAGANHVSTQVFGYDDTVPFNNRSDVYEYDFNGALLRRTHTDYVTASGYVNGDANPSLGPHLRSLRSGGWVSSDVGGENKVSMSAIEYDGYSTADFHALLKPRPNISGLCTLVISPTECDNTDPAAYLKRGNSTAATSYLLTNGVVTGSISSHQQYDIAGNVVKAIDPRSTPTNIIATTMEFDDHFGAPDGEARANAAPAQLQGQSSYAFVTSATNAVGHTAYSQFDYFLGQTVDTENANGMVSSIHYNDVLDRPKRIIIAANKEAPIKSQSRLNYDDSNRIVTSTSDLVSYDDNLLKSETLYDGLGRDIETRTYENSTQYIAVKRVPFVMLQDPDTEGWVQASQSSNPYRPSLGEQPVWTTVFSDLLGRVSKVRTPDNAIARTFYDGARVLTKDQIGNQRLIKMNALGLLTDVWEIKSQDADTEAIDPFPQHPDVAYGYRTKYEYDALTNVTKVIQASSQSTQTRTFTYDALKRVISASAPESGTDSFQYDQNGNTLIRTDGRGVSTHNAYDGLNRPTRRWYNGSNSVGETTHNYPALPASVGESNEINYWYDSQTLPAGAPEFSRGRSTGHLVATTYGTGASAGDYFSYDEGSRVERKIQQTGGKNYQVRATYNASGRIISGEYPSGHEVFYDYDGAGRLKAFSGELGDGIQRNYSIDIAYSSLGGMRQEQFGTATPIFNKHFYNVRGQLAEIREGLAPNNTGSERGAIINFYSTCAGVCAGQPMPDNNGNLKKQEHMVPDDNGNVLAVNTQEYDYDSLSRIQRVHEGSLWQQQFTYDRFGNRRVDVDINNTTASLAPKAFEVHAETNRLRAPGDSNLAEPDRQMRYDAVGNLITDNYTGQGQRIYDAENHMTKAWTNGVLQVYSYDASGHRVRRNWNGLETWQIYGLAGELLAEYPANAEAASPTKEYGYRNDQLLITADAPIGAPNTVLPSLTAAPANNHPSNGVALSWSGLSGATNYRVERKDANNNWAKITSTASTTVTDNGAGGYGTAYLYQVCAADGQDNCTSGFSNVAMASRFNFPTDPTITTLAEDPSGANLTSIKAAHINELRAAINSVRVLAGRPAAWTGTTVSVGDTVYKNDVQDLRDKLDDALRALGIPTQTYTDSTLAGAPNGTPIKAVHIRQLRDRATRGHAPGVKLQPVAVTASNSHSTPYDPSKAVDGNPATLWSAGANAPQWIQLDLGQPSNVSKIRLLVDQSPNGQTTHLVYGGPTADNLTLLETLAGSTSFGQWLELDSTATGVRFIKVQTTASPSWVGWAEIEVYGAPASTLVQVNWLVTDQLGTPRMIFEQTGSLANVKRHDYLPFGEELTAGVRTTTPGYGASDAIRQKFTGYERDEETKLNYAQARYQSDVQGRFTSPDPLLSADPLQPQSWNRYSYVINNPLNYADPSGLYYVGSETQDKDGKIKPPKVDLVPIPKDGITVKITELGIVGDKDRRGGYNRTHVYGPGSQGTGSPDGGGGSFPQFNPLLGPLGRTPDSISVSVNAFFFGQTYTLDSYGNIYATRITWSTMGDLKLKPGAGWLKQIRYVAKNLILKSHSIAGASVQANYALQLQPASEDQSLMLFGGYSAEVAGGVSPIGGSISFDGNRTPTTIGLGVSTSRLSISGGYHHTYKDALPFAWRNFIPWVREKLR